MKIAVLGKGKTGSKVIEILKEKNADFTVFDSTNSPTLEKLKAHDVIISFLAAEPFAQYIDIIIASNKPLVSGTTGFEYTEAVKNQLINNKVKWIYATNFSLGMNLVRQMILIMNKATKLLSLTQFHLHETHHTKKLDAPSGTALSWANWLGTSVEITSERTGDVIGIHELTLTTPTEEISIKHNALDRKIFAEGAVWATAQIINNPNIPYGLNLFQDIVEKEILK